MKYTSKLILNGTEYEFGAGGGGWQPGANTVAYYDFETDTTTMLNKASTGSTYDGTYYITPQFGTTADGKRYFNVGANSNYAYTPVIPFSFGRVTFVNWMYFTTPHDGFYFGSGWFSYNSDIVSILGDSSTGVNFGMREGASISQYNMGQLSGWHLVVATSDGTDIKYYVDGSIEQTDNFSLTGTNIYNIGVGTLYEQKQQTSRNFKGYFGSVIIEDKVRTDQEISDYFNQTKSLYGIS